jgi:hypothetical protein
MELKRIGAVTMGGLGGHVLGQVDDNDGVEGTLLDTHTATDT